MEYARRPKLSLLSPAGCPDSGAALLPHRTPRPGNRVGHFFAFLSLQWSNTLIRNRVRDPSNPGRSRHTTSAAGGHTARATYKRDTGFPRNRNGLGIPAQTLEKRRHRRCRQDGTGLCLSTRTGSGRSPAGCRDRRTPCLHPRTGVRPVTGPAFGHGRQCSNSALTRSNRLTARTRPA